jgi:tetratricopeptide (TPR) repeat protein
MRVKLIFSIVVTAISLKSYPQSNIDSLLSQLQMSKGIEKVDILNQLTDYYKLNSTQEAKDYALQASILAETIDYEKGIGYSSQNLGYIEYLYGNFNDAIRYSQNASGIADNLSDPGLKIRAYEVLALTYEEIAEYEKSLQYFKQALELNRLMENFVGTGLCLLGTGRIYGKMENYILSLESNQKSLNIFSRLKNDAGMAKSSMAIAKNYFSLDDYDSMSYCFNIAEELILRSGSKELLLELYIEKYQVYSGSYADSSLNYIKKAILLSDELGRVYLKRDLLLKSSELYTQRGEYQLAYDQHQSYIHLNDSLTGNQEGIGGEKLELSLNDAIYSEQEEVFREIEKINNEGRDQYIKMVYGFGFIILLISGILVIMSLRYSSQRKAVSKMKGLYKEIETLSSEINKKQEIILNLRGKDLNYEANDDINVRNEMTLASPGMNINRKMSKTEFIEQAHQQFISEQWAGLVEVRDKLRYKKEQLKLENILTDDWEYVNLDRLSQTLINSKSGHSNGEINFHNNENPDLNVFCHKEFMLLLLHLLLQNAIEAITDDGDIYIDYYADKVKVVYRIIDTGCGISLEDKSQVFAPFFSTKKQGDHYGLGLSVCLEIIKRHKAAISLKSKPGLATEFDLEFYYE